MLLKSLSFPLWLSSVHLSTGTNSVTLFKSFRDGWCAGKTKAEHSCGHCSLDSLSILTVVLISLCDCNATVLRLDSNTVLVSCSVTFHLHSSDLLSLFLGAMLFCPCALFKWEIQFYQVHLKRHPVKVRLLTPP